MSEREPDFGGDVVTDRSPTWSASEDLAPPARTGRRGRRDADVDGGGDTRAPRRRHRGRTVLIVLLVLVLPLATLALGVVWAVWQIDPPGSPGDDVNVAIRAGWGVSDIGDHLDDKGVIASSLAFQIYARATGSDSFQAGRYTLKSDMGVREAVAALEEGPKIEYRRLEVVPGLWLPEIAQEVGEQVPWLDGERFLRLATSGAVRSKYQPEGVATLEGFVWPDTYQIAEGEDERDVLRTMVREFDRHADRVGLADAPSSGAARSPLEVLVTASLVQQEARLDQDRPLIASVIYNRLAGGMPLQIDGSVNYCIGRRPVATTEADRATPCAHNTYLNAGLPPSPIGAVTERALRAALDPAESPYLFYVLADDSGRHAFAETYEEHLANVERARDAGLLG